MHSGAGGEREDVGVAVGVAGSADAYPSEGEEAEVDDYCEPIQGAEDAWLPVWAIMFHFVGGVDFVVFRFLRLFFSDCFAGWELR